MIKIMYGHCAFLAFLKVIHRRQKLMRQFSWEIVKIQVLLAIKAFLEAPLGQGAVCHVLPCSKLCGSQFYWKSLHSSLQILYKAIKAQVRKCQIYFTQLVSSTWSRPGSVLPPPDTQRWLLLKDTWRPAVPQHSSRAANGLETGRAAQSMD